MTSIPTANKFLGKIFKFFPPPSQLLIPSIGISISPEGVHCIELVFKKGKIQVGRSGFYKLEKEAISQGWEIDRNILLKILNSIKKDLYIDAAHVSIPAEEVHFFTTSLPEENVDNNTISEIVEFKMEEFVPIPPNEAIFDYTRIKHSDGNFLHSDIQTSVAHKNFVISITSVFKEAGITPVSLEGESESIARAVTAKDSSGSTMVVDFGALRTVLILINNGLVHFSFVLDIGGGYFTSTLKRSMNISEDESEEINRKIGLTFVPEKRAIYESIIGPATAFKEEIRRHIIYWDTHKQHGINTNVGQILVCGTGAYIKGLEDFLTGSLGVKTYVADVWTNTFSVDEYIPEITKYESLGYAAAIGLALRGKYR